MLQLHVLVLAKRPVAGQVKTRLTPPLTQQQAAEVALDALLDTLDVVSAADVARRTVVLDGSPDGLVPPGFAYAAQCSGSLDVRIAAAMEQAAAVSTLPVLLIGMDTPQLTTTDLADAARGLEQGPSVLGLAADGGWWALGFRRPDRDLVLGITTSTDRTGAEQHQRLVERGVAPTLLRQMTDIDTYDDLIAVSSTLPVGSRTARWASKDEDVAV